MNSGAKWFLGISAFVGLAWWGWNTYEKIQAVKAFTVDFKNIRNNSVSSGKLTFDSTLTISNASTHSVEVTRIAGNVMYNGYNIGIFTSPDNFRVVPGSQDFKLSIETPILNAAINLPKFLIGLATNQPQPLTFNGFITAAHLQIPFSFVYEVPAVELKVLLKAFHNIV